MEIDSYPSFSGVISVLFFNHILNLRLTIFSGGRYPLVPAGALLWTPPRAGRPLDPTKGWAAPGPHQGLGGPWTLAYGNTEKHLCSLCVHWTMVDLVMRKGNQFSYPSLAQAVNLEFVQCVDVTPGSNLIWQKTQNNSVTTEQLISRPDYY